MKIISNYHTHNELCKHAVGTIEDYALRAIECHYVEIGMSDHAPLPDDLKDKLFSRRMNFDEYYNIYLPELERLKIKYQAQIKILKSLEVEYLEPLKKCYPIFLKNADYLILGQHYFNHNGEYISVYNVDNPELVESYTKSVVEGVSSGIFKILAHPEVFLWRYKTWDEHCEKASRQIIEACIKNNVIMELNANGIRNSKLREKFIVYKDPNTNIEEIQYSYPNKRFFEIVKEYDVPIIINDDAHNPNYIHDASTEEAYKLAETLNLKVINLLKI